MSKSKYVLEIENKLGNGPTANAALLARYIGAQNLPKRKPDEQSKWVYWGIPVPLSRQASQASYSFSPLPEEEQWKIWISIWNESSVYDVKSVALQWLCEKKRKALRLKRSQDVIKLTSQVDNWAHSDGISQVLAEILEAKPQLFEVYKKWNRSKNPWLRRQSIVSIYFYARLRSKYYPSPEAFRLVKNLLNDPHVYVQKGVGWTLRELDRIDSKKQRVFVEKHLKQISATAWYATSELYPLSLKKELVLRRRR